MISDSALYVLADCIRADYRRTLFGRKEWIEGTLGLARNFWKARQMFNANQAFGIWLTENDLDYFNKNDRGALINMGEHIELTALVLQETMSVSYRLIWENEIQPRVPSAGNTTTIPNKSENDQKTASLPVKATNGVRENEPVTHPTTSQTHKTVARNNPLRDKPRAEEVWGIYHGHNTRTALTKAIAHAGGNELWTLILTAIDQGFLKENKSEAKTFSARLLFTDAPAVKGFLTDLDLATPKARNYVKDILMPAAIACREAILAEPNRIEGIIEDYRRAQKAEAQKESQAREIAKAVSQLPVNQQQVVVFGETFWPANDSQYDYDQLRAAVWYFRNVSGLLSDGRDNSVNSIAIGIRQSIKFLSEYATYRSDQKKMQTIFSLVRNITIMWEQNPNAECKWPMYPIGGEEGKW